MEKKIVFITAFESFITESINGKRRTSSGKRIGSETIKQYQVLHKYLLQFEQINQLSLRIVISNGLSRKIYIRERSYWQKIRRKMERFLRCDFNCFDVYIAAVFKMLRTFFNYLRGEKGLPVPLFNKVFNCPNYIYPPVILDNNQLRLLVENTELRRRLMLPFRKSLDIFILGCIAGLRYNDLINLRKTDILRFNKSFFLEVGTQKTGTYVTIPLPEFAMTIIERQKKLKNNFLFEKISNAHFNIHLKKIMELAGFTELRPKYRHQNGKLVEIKTKTGTSYRLCDHITSHSMRRIAITSLLTAGVPEQVVRKLSGHAAGSKEFYRYVTLAQGYSNREISQAQGKIFG
ncbi:tyrosine-type recombinase/integrase [Flavihumibacter profundi]|uniref:tyrosine-type recombinase/integrase n=1 Tax=Flavihumibacter profundi TaxID=2716883 RepID=UPI001CC6730C|nr:tyrosine-type recombinase/integrase [Flavihumibacter profundi]MBZ5858565.1 tyrosine-type recombinase/integrase [Flavihumibacter profundi]